MRKEVAMGGTDLPLKEPDQRCEACGALGTIGRAVRRNEDAGTTEIHRFCRACWPEERARYMARWNEESRLRMEHFMRGPAAPPLPTMGYAFEGASWHGVLEMVEMMRFKYELKPPSPDMIARFAEEWQRWAEEIGEPMPLEVEALLRKFGGR